MNVKVMVASMGLGSVAVGGAIWVTTASTGETAGTVTINAPAERPAARPAPTARVAREPVTQASDSDFRSGRRDRSEMIARFDTDGDGELSREEWQAAAAAMRAETIEKFDLDGDGELNDAERAAARRAQMLNGPRGDWLRARYDKDGDGVLSDEEAAAIDADNQKRRQETMDRLVDDFDSDGNGELSEAEREVAREAVREQFSDMRSEMTQRLDRDGDGELNRDERASARDLMTQWREQGEMIRRFDSDGDGALTALDAEGFFSLYQIGDLSADVNRDGFVDGQDVQAFTDMLMTDGSSIPQAFIDGYGFDAFRVLGGGRGGDRRGGGNRGGFRNFGGGGQTGAGGDGQHQQSDGG